MNASELHSIVKDIPEDAWPPVRYSTRGEIFENGYGFVHEEIAEMLFESSMLRWLIDRGWHVGIKNIGMVRVTVTGPNPMAIEYGPIGKRPIEALASACKAVGGKGATE